MLGLRSCNILPSHSCGYGKHESSLLFARISPQGRVGQNARKSENKAYFVFIHLAVRAYETEKTIFFLFCAASRYNNSSIVAMKLRLGVGGINSSGETRRHTIYIMGNRNAFCDHPFSFFAVLGLSFIGTENLKGDVNCLDEYLFP